MGTQTLRLKRFLSLLAAADPLRTLWAGRAEAICCGLPAFVTRCAGISERFPTDLDDLLLDDPPDASQLCGRLEEWHKDIDGYRRRMVSFGEQLRRRTWSDMAAEFIRVVIRTEPQALRYDPMATT